MGTVLARFPEGDRLAEIQRELTDAGMDQATAEWRYERELAQLARDAEAIRAAFGLLTRLPLGQGPVRSESLGRAVGYFPLVGLALGALAGVAALILSAILPPWPAAIGVSSGPR